jgi:Lrp/AsnC family leucine-responsive transcriptional regulator
MHTLRDEPPLPARAGSLDRLDLRMLRILQSDGRITNKALAAAVNLTASACHQRLQRLMDQGWIEGFMGRVNIERLCEPVQCIATICMASHAPDTFRQLEQHIDDLAEATAAYTVSGGCDFIVHFACARMSRYMELTDELIRLCPDIGNISTHVVLKQSKAFTGYPIAQLLVEPA